MTESQELLFEKEMMDRVTNWLVELSKSVPRASLPPAPHLPCGFCRAKLRSFRHTATVALISLVKYVRSPRSPSEADLDLPCSAMITVAANVGKDLDTRRRQLDAEEQKSKPESKKVDQLNADINDGADRQEEMHRLMRQCFTGCVPTTLARPLSLLPFAATVTQRCPPRDSCRMFVHRYRDVDTQIRVLVSLLPLLEHPSASPWLCRGCSAWTPSASGWKSGTGSAARSAWRPLSGSVCRYPVLFIQDSFLKYVGWCLNDKVPYPSALVL